MILQEQDERRRRKVGTGCAPGRAFSHFRRRALIGEAFDQAARQKRRRLIRIVAVIAVGFAGQKNMQDMMGIIVPLGVEPRAEVACDVILMLSTRCT